MEGGGREGREREGREGGREGGGREGREREGREGGREGGERKRREGGREGGRREGGERKRREGNETRHKAVHNLKANTYTDREEQLDDKTCSGRLATLKSWKLLICTKRRP